MGWQQRGDLVASAFAGPWSILAEEGVAAQILTNVGLKLEDVREEVCEPSSGPRTTAARTEKFADHPLVRSYRAAIDALTKEKEECVENHEFEKAAAKRDEASQIK